MAKQVVSTNRLMKPIAHFSFGLRIGDDVHIGATAGTDAARRLAGTTPGLADTTAQAERMFENFAISLEVLGARIEHTVAIRSYITDWRDLDAYRAVYARWFGSRPICHAILGTPGFPIPQASVEAELIACTGATERRFVLARGAQPEAAIERLNDALRERGLVLSDVVHLEVALADIRHLAAFDAAFLRRFNAPYPARTVTGAASPDSDALVQLEAIAVRGGGKPADPAGIAVRAGDYVYVGGQLGSDAGGTLPVRVEAQARGAWQRVATALAGAGLGVEDVVHTTNILTDWRAYAGFNAGYGAYAHAPYPPRATVIAGLPDPNALVQVQAIAHARGRDATFIRVDT